MFGNDFRTTSIKLHFTIKKTHKDIIRFADISSQKGQISRVALPIGNTV